MRLDTGATTKLTESVQRALSDGRAAVRATRFIVATAFDKWHQRHPNWRVIEEAEEKTGVSMIEVPTVLVAGYSAGPLFTRRPDKNFHEFMPQWMDRKVDGALGGVLRQIMKKHGIWARIQPDVTMLPERQDVGRALSAEEESALLLECGRSRSRILPPFVVLAFETGARFKTIRTSQWKNINFGDQCLQFGKDKTPAGTGRVVPLNQRALATLTFWAQQFPDRKPEHYVFPLEKCGQAGTKDSFGFTGSSVYETDPTHPIGAVKEAWEGAKRRTRRHCPNCKTGILADKERPEKGHACVECKFEGQELPAGLMAIRFHDLRHTAISRMIAAGVPLPIIAKIVGWSAGTMAKMAASQPTMASSHTASFGTTLTSGWSNKHPRYGHFGIEQLRGAVEAISSNGAGGSVFGGRVPTIFTTLRSESRRPSR